MVSYDAMVTEVTARLGGRTDIGARIGRWINYAFFELLLSPRFSFFELDVEINFSTVVGQFRYSIADDMLVQNLWFILNIRDATNKRHLERTHFQVIDRITERSGQPTRYYRFGNAVFFDPIPDGIYDIRTRYRKRPLDLAPGTTFEGLGSEWEEPITILAVVKGWEALDQRDKANEQRALLEPMLMVRQDVPQLEDGADSESTIAPVYDEHRW